MDVAALPEDPKLLKDVIKTLLEDNQRLEERLHILERTLFGRKSERIVSEQLLMPFAEVPAATPTPSAAPDPPPAPPSTPPREKNGHGRKPLPPHLERKRIEHDVPEGERRCKVCQAALTRIAEQIVERYEREPATFIVEQIVKAVYACTKCHGCVIVAEAPSGPIEKGLGGAGAIAHVVVGKYADHLPLERQSEMYAREGVALSPSTLGEWVGVAADLLAPIRDAMAEDLLRSPKLHFDETTLRVMEPGRGETRRGSIAVYIGDDEHPHVVYRFSPNESKSAVYEFLERYRGYVHADAAPGYDNLYKSKERIEVACWSHTRRKFFDATSTEPVIGRAATAWIRRLYDVEDAVRGRPPDEIKDVRQERAKPVLVEFEPWLRKMLPSVLPKGPMGGAIQYALNNWCALTRYLENGILDIDNNIAERMLRAVAVGRKNWLFAGSDAGGIRAAVNYTLVQSCKRIDVNPWTYLKDVLVRVSTTPRSEIATLMPHHWKATHPSPPPAPSPPPDLASPPARG